MHIMDEWTLFWMNGRYFGEFPRWRFQDQFQALSNQPVQNSEIWASEVAIDNDTGAGRHFSGME